MPRHSFIQMSKLPDLKGRISYIASPDRQENLFAVYDTADTEFWTCLARESRQEFGRFGTEGKCIEARELIIALPENFTQYDPDEVLKEFTEKFKGQYGVECTSALHYNKTKTNYHIHLIFSERRLLETPDNKIATRAVYFDETGKRVRTKKEITGEDGTIRKGCTVIHKGEIYEQHIHKRKCHGELTVDQIFQLSGQTEIVERKTPYRKISPEELFDHRAHIVADAAFTGRFIPTGKTTETGFDIQFVDFKGFCLRYLIADAFFMSGYSFEKSLRQPVSIAFFTLGTSVDHQNIHSSFSNSSIQCFAQSIYI